jgi:ceramide kinase
VVAVGGDGLFQEVMRGLLALRAVAGLPVVTACALQRLRLGHIPAGSTDAVAYTVNGCR